LIAYRFTEQPGTRSASSTIIAMHSRRTAAPTHRDRCLACDVILDSSIVN
jgi:hypothetical protein